MRIDIVTLFPAMVEPALATSMLGRARARGLVDIRVVNLRDYATGKHRVTDDYQFGGGGGMVLKPEPIAAAVEALRGERSRVILMDPRGRTGVVRGGSAGAAAVHAPRGVSRRAGAGGAAVRRPRARGALAARAGPVADVAATPRAPRGGEPDGRRAAVDRAVRARRGAGGARANREGRRSWTRFASLRRRSSRRTARVSSPATRSACT